MATLYEKLVRQQQSGQSDYDRLLAKQEEDRRRGAEFSRPAEMGARAAGLDIAPPVAAPTPRREDPVARPASRPVARAATPPQKQPTYDELLDDATRVGVPATGPVTGAQINRALGMQPEIADRFTSAPEAVNTRLSPQKEAENRRAAAKNPGDYAPEADWQTKVLDVVRSVPAGGISMIGSQMQGLSDLQEIAQRRLGDLRFAIAEKIVGRRAAEAQRRNEGESVTGLAARGLGLARGFLGERLEEGGKVIGAPEYRQNDATEIAEGIGQLGAQIVVHLGTAGTATVAGMAGQGADQMSDAVERSGKKGTWRGDLATIGGAAITGALEKTGLDKLLDRVPPNIRNGVLRRIVDYTGAGGIEAAQEVAEGLAQDVLGRALLDSNTKIGEDIAQEMKVGGAVGAIGRAALDGISGRNRAIDQQYREAAPRPLGVREAVEVAPPAVTPDDEASPLDTGTISAGKRLMDAVRGKRDADTILSENNAPTVGSRVQVNYGNRVVDGTVEDAIDTDDGELGRNRGIKIKLDDGTSFDEYFSTIRDSGISIAPIAAPAPAPMAETRAPVPVAPLQPTAAPRPRPAQSDQLETYLAAARGAESGGNDRAANKISSADGRYQFLDKTWAPYHERLYGGDGLNDKFNVEKQERIMRAFTEDNAAGLRKSGVEVNVATLYAAHHFGLGGAIAMGKNPGGAVDADVVKYNPQFRGMTNAQALAWTDRHVNKGKGNSTSLARVSQDGQGYEPTALPDRPLPENSDLMENTFAQATQTPVTAPAADTTALEQPIANSASDLPAAFSGTGQAMSSNLYDSLFEKVERGETKENGETSALLQVAAQIKARGGTVTRESLPEIAAAYTQAPEGGPERQEALRSIVEANTPRLTGDTAAADPAPEIAPTLAPAPLASFDDAGPMPTLDAPRGPTVEAPSSVRIVPNASGKGLTIEGATEADIGRIRAALPEKASLAVNSRTGSISTSAKYEDQIRAAIEPTARAEPLVTGPLPVASAAPDATPPAASGATPSTVDRGTYDDWKSQGEALGEGAEMPQAFAIGYASARAGMPDEYAGDFPSPFNRDKNRIRRSYMAGHKAGRVADQTADIAVTAPEVSSAPVAPTPAFRPTPQIAPLAGSAPLGLAPPAATATRAPLPTIEADIARVGTRAPDVAITSGREVPVRYAVVEASSLVASNTDDGSVNPDFPAELQPRDRSRGTSQAQIASIAANLDPRLLGASPKASDGAPIIAPSGVVESGNGRTLAIRRAYEQGGEPAQRYRDNLAAQGFDVQGMQAPVLVRVRQGDMAPQEVQAFTREANERDNLSFSSTEQAQSDSRALDDNLLDLYRGGDIDAAGNRDFVRAFIGTAVGPNDQAAMIQSDGSMSRQAVSRIEAALLSKAYGNERLVAQMTEATDTNIKAIGGALTDVAGAWSKMRAAATDGRIDPVVDATPFLNEAVALVDRARREGRAVSDLVGQSDIFSGTTIAPETEAFVRLMFATNKFTKATGRERLADALRFYADEAMKAAPGGGLFGDADKATPLTIAALAKDKQDGAGRQGQDDIFAAAVAARDPSADAPSPSRNGDGPVRDDVSQTDGDEAGSDRSKEGVAPPAAAARLLTSTSGDSDAVASGRGAAAEGKPRERPSYFTPTMAGNSKYREWLKGWDAETAARAAEAPRTTSDPKLTRRERAALDRLLVSQKKGGEGWNKESSAYAQVRDILDAGATRNQNDENMLVTALRMQETAEKRAGPAAESAPEKDQGTSATRPQVSDNTEIGRNADGQRITEDANGVRTIYNDKGTGRQETVGLRPVRGGGYETVLNPRTAEFEVASEATKTVISAPSTNTIFTEDAYEAAKKRMRDRMSQLNSGIDPAMLMDGMVMAGYHLEKGARSFAAYAKAMIDDLGPQITPSLRSFYEAIRYDPRAAAWAGEMSGPEDIGAALAALDAEPKRGTVASEETADAGLAEASGARSDDRASDEGPGTGDLPEPEGGRRAGNDAAEPSSRGAGNVRADDERSGRRSEPGEPQPVRDGEGAGNDNGAQPGRQRRDRSGDRVRRTDRGTNYLAPRGSLRREGGWRATAERNLDIIELVNTLDAEARPATVEEQALLAKFTGWGAGEIRNNLFRNIQRDPATGERSIPEGYYGEWKDTQTRASKLLRGTDLETALQSTQYAHYTSEPVIRSIWDAMDRMGFKGGRIMEPGMGIGLFATAAPTAVMEGSSYTGIELDTFTAKVAGYLLPQETAVQADFVKHRLPDGFFDVAIGNPPFSATKVLDDPAYKKHRLSLHDYFFAKSIDKVRPGGLMVFVTSRYTMDKLKDRGRQYIAERADLLGAIRLPQTAFKDNAGTEVVTDVLFFQRRVPGAEPGGEAWLGVDTVKAGTEKVLINEYFARNPKMVLGKHATTGSMYSKNEYTVEPLAGDIADHFAKAVKGLPENIYAAPIAEAAGAAKAKAWEADMRPAAEKEGGLYVADGKVFIRVSGVGKPVSAIDRITPADEAWLTGYAGVRDALKLAQKDQLGDGDWEGSLAALNKAYDAFAKTFGPLQANTVTERKSIDEDGTETVTVYRRLKNQKLLDLDVESPLIFGLEKVSDDGTVSKGDFLKSRTLNKPTRPKTESVQDGLAVTLDELGRLDLDYIATLMKMDRAGVVVALGSGIYKTPTGIWQTADEYLSGDVLAKLDEARAAAEVDPKYRRNVEALAGVQPKPLGPQDITLKLGAGWIPVDVVKRFASEIIGLEVAELQYEPATAEWGMDGKGARRARSAAEEYGTADKSPQEILTSVLNNQTIKVTRKNSDGSTFTDQEATAAANDVAKKLSERFKTWAWEDASRASELLDLYNTKFNNLAPRRFDGSHLTFPGLSANYKLYDHQKRAIWRVVQTGNVYLAHAVGAGKTLEMIVSGMEQKRLGLIKKPMYVVPNHMLNQFAREFMEAYPAASIMVADDKAFHTDNRRRFMAQASLNAPDAIIITHSSFGKLGTSPESRAAVVQKMVQELEAALEGSDTRYTIAKIEKQIEALKRNFEAKTGSDKDQALTFEEMGVDYVYVDEAHLFRKLDYATNRNVKGIDPKGSQRALDLYIKTRWLEQQKPGRSLTLASGTPVTNTMAEIYTVMRYMNESELERDGLRAFDAWANMFGEVAAGYEQNAAGGYEIVERFAKFVNVPELMKRVRTFMDVLTSENLGDLVKRPSVNGGVPHSVVSPPIDSLAEYMKGELKERIERSRAWKPSKEEPANPDPIIAINTDARLASIDMRFINPTLPNDPGSKLNRMIDQIVERNAALKGLSFVNPKTGGKEPVKGGTQIVFSAVGFGEGAMTNRGFDLRSWMDGRLIKEAGLKKTEIAWMSDANSHAKKEALFKDMRAGRIKVLVGSPANMGTGVNVQNRLKALHFLAPPWYPADVEQPHGRIIRQGNWNEDVDLYWYATKGTYDSTAWGMVSRKARFIEQAMSGDDSVRSLDDISEANQYEMASALAAGDERIIQIAGYSSEIERLTRLQGAHADEQQSLAQEQRYTRQSLQRRKERVATLEEAFKLRDATAPFALKVGASSFDKPGEGGKALIEALRVAITERQAIPSMRLATYQGKHEIGVQPAERSASGTFVITVKVGDYETEVIDPTSNLDDLDAVGLAGRVSNAVARIPAALRTEQANQADAELALKKIDRKLGAPFAEAQQLAEKIAERANLQQQLAAETAAADAAPKPAATPKASIAPDDSFTIRLTGEELGEWSDMRDLRLKAQAWAFRTLRDTEVVDARGNKVIINKTGIKKSVSGNQGDFLLRALPAIPEIIRQGRVLVPLSPDPERRPDVQGIEWLAANVSIAGEVRDLAVAIRLMKDGRRQYDLATAEAIVKAVGGRREADGATSMTLGDPAKEGTPDALNLVQIDEQFNTAATLPLWASALADARKQLADAGLDDKITVEAVSRFFDNPRIAGQYMDRVITVAMESAQPAQVTVDHEIIHALHDLNLFRDPEWTALRKAAVADTAAMQSVRARYAAQSLSEDALIEEVVAERYAAWAAQERQERGFAALAFRRVREFLAALGEALRGNFTSPTAVMRAIGRGEIGQREEVSLEQTTANGIRRLSVAALPSDPSDIAFDEMSEARWQDATKGVGDGPNWVERSRGWWSDVAIGFTRHWRALPNEPRFADLQQQFRKLEAAPEAATEEVVRRLSSLVKGFKKADLDLFARKAVLDDLQWEADAEHKLPFGLNVDSLAEARARVDAALALPSNSHIADAVRRRKLVNKQLADDMVAAGVLTREQIKNPAYYRHMVLDFARAEMRMARTPGSKIKSPYWAKRMGSSLDINANLLEAEFDWMQKALIDIATANTIEWVKKSKHNIRDQLRAQAKASNKAGVAEKVDADTTIVDGKKVRGPIAKAELYFRQLVARGMEIVQKELQDGNLDPIPAHLESAADALATGVKGEPPFALMTWILDNDKAGAMGAAMVLKSVGQRKTWEMRLLGDKYLDPEDVPALVKSIGPAGYSAWQPVDGQHLFTVKTISESALDMFVQKLADTEMPGLNNDELARALGSIRNQLVIGGDRYTMVLPEEVTDTLNEFGDRRAAGMAGKLFAELQGAWKRWMLINPRRVLKYNINNLTGDLDAIIAGNPGALRKVGQAGAELYAVMKNGAKPSERYTEAVERGVFTSGLSVQEIPDINSLSALRHLTDKSRRPDKMILQGAGAVWRALQGFTQWRESVFRYASYLDYVAKLESGSPMAKVGYGASVPAMVDAVSDNRDKAALLARDLVGDYGSISVAGAWLRRYLIPFWSWTEINTRRYYRLTSNAYSQSVSRGLATGGLLGAGVAAQVGVALALRMATVYGALWLWNNLLFGDEEDELGDMQKRQLHLILGRDSDGKVMTLRTQGALSDVLGMLGFPDAVKGIKNYENGQGTLGQAVGDTLKAPINRVVGGVSPFIGEPLEQVMGVELWPDAFNARQIHDKWRHLFQTVNLENEYDAVRDKPTRGYAYSWTESLVYRRDPGEMAYDDNKGRVYDWLRNVKGEGGGSSSTPRSGAMREYRQAVRYGDADAANHALDKYEELGGTAKTFKQSVKAQHPLGPLSKAERGEFVDSLTDEQYDTLLEAEEFYQRTYLTSP